MVRHDGETVQVIFALLAISDKGIQEEPRVLFLLEMKGLLKGRDGDGVSALVCGHAGKHTSGLKPFISLEPMRPKPKGLGYLIVAGSELKAKAKAKAKARARAKARAKAKTKAKSEQQQRKTRRRKGRGETPR